MPLETSYVRLLSECLPSALDIKFDKTNLLVGSACTITCSLAHDFLYCTADFNAQYITYCQAESFHRNVMLPLTYCCTCIYAWLHAAEHKQCPADMSAWGRGQACFRLLLISLLSTQQLPLRAMMLRRGASHQSYFAFLFL